MKLSILLLFLTSAIVSADDRKSVEVVQEAPRPAAATSAAQQFEEADISLAVAHYKRLKEKANEVRLELVLKVAVAGPVDPTDAEEISQRKRAQYLPLIEQINYFERRASEWRAEVEARANKSASTR